MKCRKSRAQPRPPRLANGQRGNKVNGRPRAHHALVVLRSRFGTLGRRVGGGNEFGKINRAEEVSLAEKHAHMWAIELIRRAGEKIAVQGTDIRERMRRGVYGIDKYQRSTGVRHFRGATRIGGCPQGIGSGANS